LGVGSARWQAARASPTSLIYIEPAPRPPCRPALFVRPVRGRPRDCRGTGALRWLGPARADGLCPVKWLAVPGWG
jgi:hypothetical protein